MLTGEVNENGMLAGLDFSDIKTTFRTYIDNSYDHSVLLNREDPWADMISRNEGELGRRMEYLPGLRAVVGDPTTENIARKIGEWSRDEFFVKCQSVVGVSVIVHETETNAASWSFE
jgi:6-pyruvoyl-tetrahydropterin synthase